MKEEKDLIQEELEAMSPLLARMRKEKTASGEPGEVPYQYFERLPDKVMQEINKGAGSTSTWQAWWASLTRRTVLIPTLATVALVLVAVSLFWMQADTEPVLADENTSIPAVDPNEADEIQAYIAAHIEDFEADWIWDATLADAETSEEEINVSEEYLDELIDDLDADDIEDLF